MNTRRLIALLGLAAGCSALAAREPRIADSLHRTLPVAGPVDLEVTTGAGHIHLRAGEPGEVRITGTVRGPEFLGELPVEQEGNRIRVGRDQGPEWNPGGVSISYEIVVPPETRLWTHTGVGGQRLEGIHGPVEAVSSSGRLTLTQIEGEVRARTGVGDIRLTEVGGDVTAMASNGSIYGSGIAGMISARTRVGHVRLENNLAPESEVATSSGNVEVTGAQGAVRVRTGVGHIAAAGVPEGEWNLGTGVGNVEVRVPDRRGLHVYACTTSGRIETGGRAWRRRELRRGYGAGRTLLHIRTGVGNIRIE